METTTIRYKDIDEVEAAKKVIPVTMWYQHETDRENFEFLNMGQLIPLKRWHNTIISVKNYILKCSILYANTNESFRETMNKTADEIIENFKTNYLKGHTLKQYKKYIETDEYKDNLDTVITNARYKMFKQMLVNDPSLKKNLDILYKERIEKFLNKNVQYCDECYVVSFEYMPAELGFDVDCYKIVATKVKDLKTEEK